VIWAAESHRRLLAHLRAEEGARQLRNYELAHRIRNILASVQAIIRQSLRNHGDILEVLDARVTALVATHDLLVRSDSHVVSLREILARVCPVWLVAPRRQGRAGRVSVCCGGRAPVDVS
jgi:two-component sensor histidine kinase